MVREAHMTDPEKLAGTITQKTPTPLPRKATSDTALPGERPTATPQKKKVKKGKVGLAIQDSAPPQPSLSAGLPRLRPPPLRPSPQPGPPGPEEEGAEPTPPSTILQPQDPAAPWDIRSTETMSSSLEEERPISPFYISNHLCPVHCRPDVANFLERTISSAVERHLFDDAPAPGGQSLDDAESTPPRPSTSSPAATPTARQRRRRQRERQDESRREGTGSSAHQEDVDKENIPEARAAGVGLVCVSGDGRREGAASRPGSERSPRTPTTRKSAPCPALGQHRDHQDTHTLKECSGPAGARDGRGTRRMDSSSSGDGSHSPGPGVRPPPRTLSMKIQESSVVCDGGGGGVRAADPERDAYDDVPRLDLSDLTEDSKWGDPAPAYSSWQRESMEQAEEEEEQEEAPCLSPLAGGRLIRQLLEEESDPMLSPRFHAYGHCQQYLDDTEVPPSPPNAHSFTSRRRSSSLGSCDDAAEEMTAAQMSKKIQGLKRKIRKYEEKFEDERKYRPSHCDKAANPEVLRWMNELARLRKDLKEHKLLKSEEDLPPLPRQRSNTLPKSFGSQLEKKPAQEKAAKPPVEDTLEAVLARLQEKREETGRPHDIKDMTREQICAEKVALQKALLYYEGIHGRPVTKSERQIMKPLYDRYRLVKQILCRASTIPVIEEEDGSEDDCESKTQVAMVTVRPDLGTLGFLEQLEEESDGFISPMDELSPAKNTSDMRLSNLHSATVQELVEQLQETREEKKRIRKNLREFEDQFFRQNGRNVQKEDRSPLAVEYNEYKHVKAKLRLLEVLISKRDSSKFI